MVLMILKAYLNGLLAKGYIWEANCTNDTRWITIDTNNTTSLPEWITS